MLYVILRRNLNILVLLGIVLLTAGIYIHTLNFPFLFDDNHNIVKAYTLRNTLWWKLPFQSTRWISHCLTSWYYHTWGLNSYYYRLGNLIFHLITIILLWIFLQLTIIKKRPNSLTFYMTACIAVALYALHPVQVQTVCYIIQGQQEGVAALLLLASCVSYILYCQSQTRIRWLWLGFCFIIAILGTGSKEIFIIAPALLLLVDWFFVAEGKQTSLLARWPIHALLTTCIGAYYLLLLKPEFFIKLITGNLTGLNNPANAVTSVSVKTFGAWDYLISQFQVIIHYFGIFIAPYQLSVDYDFKLVPSFFSFESLVPLMLIITLLGYCFSRLRKDPTDLFAFGIVWFFIALLPRSSIIPNTELAADYKTYPGSAGICISLACICVASIELIGRYFKSAYSSYAPHAASSLLIILCMVQSYRYSLTWSDAESLWAQALLSAPDKPRVLNNYAAELINANELDRALFYIKSALHNNPQYPEAVINLAHIASLRSEYADAIEFIAYSAAMNPNSPEIYNNWGSYLMRLNRFEEAEDKFKQALSLRPQYGKAHYHLGMLYRLQQRPEQAYTHFKRSCLEGEFLTKESFWAYGTICAELEKYDEAVVGLNHALRYAPQDPAIRFELASCYYALQDFTHAVDEFKRVTEIIPQDPHVWYNLAESYIKCDNFSLAYTAYAKAIELKCESSYVYLKMAQCLEHMGNSEEAEKIMLALNE